MVVNTCNPTYTEVKVEESHGEASVGKVSEDLY
jgi:hypothetical protein